MKTLIAIPCEQKMDVEFVSSLYYLKKVGEVDVVFHPNSLVYVAREHLSNIAVNHGYDYCLWIDSDMVFDSDMLEKLIADAETGLDCVAGLFFRRRSPYTPALWKTIRLGLDNDSIEVEYPDYPADTLFEIDACGMAAVLMRTSMMRDVINHNGTIFQPMRNYGEDISACLRIRKLGYQIWCDSRIKVGHIAHTIVTEKTYRALERSKQCES